MKLDSSAFVACDELIAALGRVAKDLPCGEDIVLFEQGEAAGALYILHEGQAALSMKTDDGEEAASAVASRGSLLGLPAVVGKMPYSLTATARRGSRVSFVSQDDFSRLMLNQPALAVQVLQVLAAEVRAARFSLTKI